LVASGTTSVATTISFTAPLQTVTTYNFSAVPTSGTTVSGTFSGALTTYQITGLSAGKTYTITLTATNASGTSETVSIVISTTSVPDPPTNLSVSGQGTTSFTVSFTAPSQSLLYYDVSAVSGATVPFRQRFMPYTIASPTFANQSTMISNQRNDNLGLALTAPGSPRLAVFTNFASVNYVRIINGSWGTYSTATTTFNVTPNGTNRIACAMTPDATRLIISAGTYANANNWIYWADASGLLAGTSTSLSFTRIADTNQRMYMMAAVTADGNRFVVSDFNNSYVYFSTWNGTNYGALTAILDTTTRAYISIGLSPDGNKLLYGAVKTIYWSVWNGTNYTAGTAIPGNVNGNAIRSAAFIGNNTEFVINTPESGQPQYTLWNGTGYNNWTNVPSAALPTNVNGWGLATDGSGEIFLAPYANTNVFKTTVSFTQTARSSLVVYGLSAGTTYSVAIKSANQFGESATAGTVSGTTSDVQTSVQTSYIYSTYVVFDVATVAASYTYYTSANATQYVSTSSRIGISGFTANTSYTLYVRANGVSGSFTSYAFTTNTRALRSIYYNVQNTNSIAAATNTSTGNSWFTVNMTGSGYDMWFGTGDFTVEMYLNVASTSGSPYPRLFAIGGYPNASFAVEYTGDNNIIWRGGTSSGTAAASTLISYGSMVTNTWRHYAYSRNSGVLYCYLNGVLRGSLSDTTNYSSASGYTTLVINNEISKYANFGGHTVGFTYIKGAGLYNGSGFSVGSTVFTPRTSPLLSVTSGTLLLSLVANNTSFENYGIVQTSNIVSSGGAATGVTPTYTNTTLPTGYAFVNTGSLA
jgi:hypothetical protein